MATAQTRGLSRVTQAPIPSRTAGKTPTFLVTLATHRERPVFGISRLAERFIETLLALRIQGVYKLHAFVVLPARVYLLVTPQRIPVERAVELTIAAFAQHLDTVRAVWEPGFESHPVHTIRDLERLRTHLYQLPVRARLATSPELYPYSSAGPGRETPQLPTEKLVHTGRETRMGRSHPPHASMSSETRIRIAQNLG